MPLTSSVFNCLFVYNYKALLITNYPSTVVRVFRNGNHFFIIILYSAKDLQGARQQEVQLPVNGYPYML